MEKLMEKRNLGIPVTILTFFAFLIGYAMTQNYSNILIGALYAFVIFSFTFDDKVKSAVKQSYILSFVSTLVYLALDVFYQFVDMISPADYNYNFIQRAFNGIYKYGRDIVNVAVIVLYIIFMIFALIRKEMKVGVISNVLGEGTPKPVQNFQQPMYQQPYPQPQQFNQPGAAPMPNFQQPPQQPAGQPAQGVKCAQCGKVNLPGAAFCASCGAKLN
jgi:hypothetical protein